MSESLTPSQDTPPVLTPLEVVKPWGRLQPCISYLDAVDLVKSSIKLGRGEDCDIVIHKRKFVQSRCLTISKHHFLLIKESLDKPAYIVDLSKNGTFLNGVLIGKDKRNVLQGDDVISIGHKALKAYVFRSVVMEQSSYLPMELRKKYEVSRFIGRGAVGEVRLAYEKSSCQEVAIKKIIKGRFSANNQQLNHPNKIETEINILKTLSHPCIVGMREIIDTKDEVFIVLDYMKGGELTNRILSAQNFPEDTVKFLFYQICLAVQYLHKKNITHRDLKPENVLLLDDQPQTLTKVTDFGLSKISEEQMQTICGTLHYIAPEVIDGKQKDYRKNIDVWSLGVMLFYMLSRSLPFSSTERPELFRSILRGLYKFDRTKWMGISLQAIDLIKRMLTVDPQKRITIEAILRHPWISKDLQVQFGVKTLMDQHCGAYQIKDDQEDGPPIKRICLG